MKNIGIINVDNSPSGLHQFLLTLLPKLVSYKVVGIEWNEQENKLQIKDLQQCGSPYPTLKKISSDVFERLYTDIHSVDRLIVIGGGEAFKRVQKKISTHNQIDCLFIPASIHNNITWTELSLGYDTAINSIIESTLKVSDTIASLKYSTPRLFGVQIPGHAPTNMLRELAIAVDGFYLDNLFYEEGSSLQKSLKDIFTNGMSYSFLLFDERVKAMNNPPCPLPELEVDWKVIQIDEALCMGQRPSAMDRIIAKKFAYQAVQWISSRGESSLLCIDRREVKLKRYSMSLTV